MHVRDIQEENREISIAKLPCVIEPILWYSEILQVTSYKL